MYMKLRDLYYKLKYRNLKSGAGAVGVIFGSKKKNDDFNAKLEEIAKRTTPCYKANDEVLTYIRERYNLTPATFSNTMLENYKVNYILNECPEVLTTPEQLLPDNGKAPTRKQMEEFHENNNKRFEEAWSYPIEKLGLEFKTYIFEYILPDGYKVKFDVIAEKNKDRLSITSTINRIVSDDEQKLIRRICDEIEIYKGVTQEDIDNRTKRFIGYAAAVIELERINDIA